MPHTDVCGLDHINHLMQPGRDLCHHPSPQDLSSLLLGSVRVVRNGALQPEFQSFFRDSVSLAGSALRIEGQTPQPCDQISRWTEMSRNIGQSFRFETSANPNRPRTNQYRAKLERHVFVMAWSIPSPYCQQASSSQRSIGRCMYCTTSSSF